MLKKLKTPGRNDQCPCGSGKKAKHCCLGKIKIVANLPPEIRNRTLAASIMRGANAQKPE
jgi:hypothetical protein